MSFTPFFSCELSPRESSRGNLVSSRFLVCDSFSGPMWGFVHNLCFLVCVPLCQEQCGDTVCVVICVARDGPRTCLFVISRLLKTMCQNRCCSRSETFRFSLAPKGVVCPAARLHRSGAQTLALRCTRSPDEFLVGVVSQRFQATDHVALSLALVNQSRDGQDDCRALQATTVLVRQSPS